MDDAQAADGASLQVNFDPWLAHERAPDQLASSADSWRSPDKNSVPRLHGSWHQVEALHGVVKEIRKLCEALIAFIPLS